MPAFVVIGFIRHAASPGEAISHSANPNAHTEGTRALAGMCMVMVFPNSLLMSDRQRARAAEISGPARPQPGAGTRAVEEAGARARQRQSKARNGNGLQPARTRIRGESTDNQRCLVSAERQVGVAREGRDRLAIERRVRSERSQSR